MADPHQEPVASSGLSTEEETQMEPSTSQTFDFESSTSLSEDHPPLRQKMKIKNEKICRVCGDKALGYNFNAITCESCKAFFRRNAFKDKSMKCLFENNCAVDIRTRRFCPACRIKKCFSIGMNRDMILDDRERKKRQSKKVVTSTIKAEDVTSEANPLLVTVKSEVKEEEIASTSSMDYTDLMGSPSPPSARMHGEKPNISFKHPPPEALPKEKNMYPELSEREKGILSSVVEAYQCTLASDSCQKLERYENTADLINHSELVVRKLIMFVKYLEDFKVMSQEDQIACLKACVMHSILLRSALYYSVEKDAWLTDKEQYIPTSILKSATGFVSIHNNHVTYCRKVKAMAENDLNVYAMMQVLIIFDPAGQNITNREFIATIQDRYFIILKHYLESRYSYKYSKEYFASSIECLCDLKSLSENHSKILLQVNPLDVEPLMLEVLNLK